MATVLSVIETCRHSGIPALLGRTHSDSLSLTFLNAPGINLATRWPRALYNTGRYSL